jgi:hypothetical protein
MTATTNFDFYFTQSELTEWENNEWITNVIYSCISSDGCVYTANYLGDEVKILVK